MLYRQLVRFIDTGTQVSEVSGLTAQHQRPAELEVLRLGLRRRQSGSSGSPVGVGDFGDLVTFR
jgi:hypothetical protein